MSRIDYEDRTTESPETAANRQIQAVSNAIIGTAIMASQGVPAVGLGALVLAIGQVAARTGVSIDEVVEAIRTSHQAAAGTLAQIQRRPSDA